MISDKSREVFQKILSEFMSDLKVELDIIHASWCQVSINFNRDIDPKISAKIEISQKESFHVENDKLFNDLR